MDIENVIDIVSYPLLSIRPTMVGPEEKIVKM